MSDQKDKTLPETDFGYGQLLSIFIRQKVTFLGVFLVVLCVTSFLVLTGKPKYKSAVNLLLEPNYQKREEKGATTGEQFSEPNIEIDFATQLKLMQSDDLLQKVVDILKVEDPNLTLKEFKRLFSVSQILTPMRKGIEVETKIFKVEYTSEDPEESKRVVEVLQKVYQEENLKQQQLRLTEGLAFIDQQLPLLRQKVANLEAQLNQFRQQNQLIAPLEEASKTSDNLQIVKQKRQEISSQYQETWSRYTNLQQQLGRSVSSSLLSSRLSQSPRYQALLDELQKIELAIAQQEPQYTDAHPQLQLLLEQRQNHLELIKEEAKIILDEVTDLDNLSLSDLRQEGNLGKLDQELASQLVETHNQLVGLQARQRSLRQTEQELLETHQRFTSLISEYNRLQPELEIQRSSLESLLQARQELAIEIARGGFQWQVVEAPKLGKKTGLSRKKQIFLGGIVGVFLGVIIAFIRDSLDDAVHTSHDLKKHSDLPLLGLIPEYQPTHSLGFMLKFPLAKLQVNHLPTMNMLNWLPVRESLDLIYKNIRLLDSSSTLHSLAVTSAMAGEGKSTLALGLARSAGRLCQRVLLIDADLRHPTLHQVLNLPNEQGLSTLLADNNILPRPQSAFLTGVNLDVLTAGLTSTDPVKLLSSQRMKNLMVYFRQTYDLVVVDTSPLLGLADVLEVVSMCDGTVMVGRMDRITQFQLTHTLGLLSGFNVMGIVANGTRKVQYYSANGRYNSHQQWQTF